MSFTPEQVRAELLLQIWQTGPRGIGALSRTGSRLGLSAVQVETELAHLCAAGLIQEDRASVSGDWSPLTCYGPVLDAEDAARREYARLTGAQACRFCGCSDNWACPEGCFWLETDLCTSCAWVVT